MKTPANPADPKLAEPGRKPTGADARAKRDDEDDEDEWRHEPVAPVNEPNPLRSLGKAVGETVTGSDPAAARPRKR